MGIMSKSNIYRKIDVVMLEVKEEVL